MTLNPPSVRGLLASMVSALLVLLLACAARADLPEIQNSGVLRWGGDQEGGGPYIFAHEDDPKKLIGFEVELAAALGRALGVEPKFTQCSWPQLLSILERGDIDLCLNGYEYNEQRAAEYHASIPYYRYELGLYVRTDNTTITGWQSLEAPGPGGKHWKVGVLSGSAAQKLAEERYGANCELRQLDGVTDVMGLVENGQLDATIQDLPIGQFYIDKTKRFTKLRLADKPQAPGFYVIYTRKDEPALGAALDTAIQKLYRSGELREIYERYGVWNAAQEQLPRYWETWGNRAIEVKREVARELRQYLPLFVQAAGVTVLLAVFSMPLAILIGLVLALVRCQGTGTALPDLVPTGIIPAWLIRLPATLYVELIRGTPLVFQLMVVYFVLPYLGISLDAFTAGVVALAINYSAYEAEIFRLGLQAIPRGQLEAAQSLGMSNWLAARRIILPQAVRLVIPATANDFIALFKDTAVCAVISVVELSKQYYIAAQDKVYMRVELAVLASVLYLAMSVPLSWIARWLEVRLTRGSRP